MIMMIAMLVDIEIPTSIRSNFTYMQMFERITGILGQYHLIAFECLQAGAV